MEKISKVTLLKTVKNYLENIGAKKVDDLITSFSSYELETKAGILKINIDLDIKSTIFSIFCRFNDVEEAKKLVGRNPYDGNYNCNPYTGKYNLHIVDKKLTSDIIKESLDNHFDCLINE